MNSSARPTRTISTSFSCWRRPAPWPGPAPSSAEARGFVYYVSVTGVTGARAALPVDLSEMVRRIRAISPVPVGVGFGIASPQQAAEVARIADAVIVGSAISQIIETHQGQADLLPQVGQFVASLKHALRSQAGLGATPLAKGVAE